MKILYIVSNMRRCGPTNQLYNIIKYLDRNLFEPYIITLSPEPDDSYLDEFKRLAVPCISAKRGRLGGVLFAKRFVGKFIKIIRPDIIHTQGIRADAISSKLKMHTARISTQRNYPFHDYPMKYGSLVGKLIARYHYRLLKDIPQVIACSRTIAMINVKHGLSAEYIRNGVDCHNNARQMAALDRVQIRSSLGISPYSTTFVSSGSLIERKAPRILIEAFKSLDGDDCHLLILGDGCLRKECEALAATSNNIHFLGHVSNVRDYLAAADCFVSTSLSEGMPNAALEAMSMGLPVVLSDIPSHREIFEMEPSIGSLFDQGDVTDLYKKMAVFKPGDHASRASRSVIENGLTARTMSFAYQQRYIALKDQTGRTGNGV